MTVEQLTTGWTTMLDGQSTPARARFLAGRVDAVEGDKVHFVLPTEGQIQRCEKFRKEIEAALEMTFGTPLTLVMRADDSPPPSPMRSPATPAPAAASVQDESEIDIHDLTDADVGNASVVERITDVFPGAEVLDNES